MKFKQGKLNLSNNGLQPGTQDEVDILFTGDLCMWMKVEGLILAGKTDEILSSAYPVLHNKDISIVNLECPLSKGDNIIKKLGPTIGVDPGCLDFVLKAGFDVASIANNHIADYGSEAVMETIGILKNNNIIPVGAGKNNVDAAKTVFIKKNNINIALISVSAFVLGLADEYKAGPSFLEPLSTIRQIKEAAKQADITVVMVHAGYEFYPLPSPRTALIYRSFIEAGASAVIGHHPHCPQGVEIYNGCPIIYSLGNFLFDIEYPDKNHAEHSWWKDLMDCMWWSSYMVRILFNRNGALKLEIIPYTFGPDASAIKILEDNEKEDFIKYLECISNIITDEKELRMYWYAWCRTHGPAAMDRFKGVVGIKEWQDVEITKEILVGIALNGEGFTELAGTFMKMVCDRKINIADSYIPKMKMLQKGLLNDIIKIYGL